MPAISFSISQDSPLKNPAAWTWSQPKMSFAALPTGIRCDLSASQLTGSMVSSL